MYIYIYIYIYFFFFFIYIYDYIYICIYINIYIYIYIYIVIGCVKYTRIFLYHHSSDQSLEIPSVHHRNVLQSLRFSSASPPPRIGPRPLRSFLLVIAKFAGPLPLPRFRINALLTSPKRGIFPGYMVLHLESPFSYFCSRFSCYLVTFFVALRLGAEYSRICS